MSSWMINIELTVERVCRLLRSIDGATVVDIPGGIGLDFGEQRVAWVGDARPDAGTDIIVKDATGTIGWVLYDFLAERTSQVLWMTDDGGLVLASRGVTPDELGLEGVADQVLPLDGRGGTDEAPGRGALGD